MGGEAELADTSGADTHRWPVDESMARVVNLRSLPVAAIQDDAVIDLRDLEVWYEPQIDLTSGALVGFEALLRWRHPSHGLLGPERALASAARCGLEVHVLALVLDHACAEA